MLNCDPTRCLVYVCYLIQLVHIFTYLSSDSEGRAKEDHKRRIFVCQQITSNQLADINLKTNCYNGPTLTFCSPRFSRHHDPLQGETESPFGLSHVEVNPDRMSKGTREHVG